MSRRTRSLPIIGVNADLEKERLYLKRSYVERILRAGGVPLVLPPVTDRRALLRQLEGIDALLLSGADDYRPSLYGRRGHPAVKLVLREREEYDLALCAAAYKRSLPILAICGGMQLLTIVRGGTLVVHVDGHQKTHHAIAVTPGSLLAGVVGVKRLRVNSFHHQVVEEPGKGLRAVAFSGDRSIEALEGAGDRFLLAVQWHPERMKGAAADRLFTALITAARDA